MENPHINSYEHFNVLFYRERCEMQLSVDRSLYIVLFCSFVAFVLVLISLGTGFYWGFFTVLIPFAVWRLLKFEKYVVYDMSAQTISVFAVYGSSGKRVLEKEFPMQDIHSYFNFEYTPGYEPYTGFCLGNRINKKVYQVYYKVGTNGVQEFINAFNKRYSKVYRISEFHERSNRLRWSSG